MSADKPTAARPTKEGRPRRVLSDILTVVLLFGLLGAVTLLPPDTSLAEIEAAGRLRACVPDSYPPLVTADPQKPGVDVDILQAVAKRMDLTLTLNRNSAIGRDLNPRNWRVNRAQCQILAGGVVVSALTRSFLETTPPHLETGWAITWPGAPAGEDEAPASISDFVGKPVGFHAGLAGLDRIALARALRAAGIRAIVINRAEDLAPGIESGRFVAVIGESVMAARLAADHGWQVAWLPEGLGRNPIAFGLWKGDLTLKRAVLKALNEMEADGMLAEIMARYGIVPISQTLAAAPEPSS